MFHRKWLLYAPDDLEKLTDKGVNEYEDKDTGEIMDFMKSKCIKTF